MRIPWGEFHNGVTEQSAPCEKSHAQKLAAINFHPRIHCFVLEIRATMCHELLQSRPSSQDFCFRSDRHLVAYRQPWLDEGHRVNGSMQKACRKGRDGTDEKDTEENLVPTLPAKCKEFNTNIFSNLTCRRQKNIRLGASGSHIALRSRSLRFVVAFY